MKFNKIILLIIVLMIFSNITFAVAGDNLLKINDKTFKLPDDFEIDLEEENNYLLVSEDAQTYIVINNNDDILNDYTIEQENNYTVNNKLIKESLLVKEDKTTYFYKIDEDNINFIVKSSNEDWNITDSNNPLNQIIISMG